MHKYKIALGLISGDFKVNWMIVQSLLQASNAGVLGNYYFEPIFFQGIYPDINRNKVADAFLHHTDCEFLWMLDYDNAFFPEAIDLFMRNFENDEIDIVSGAYYMKKDDQLIYVAGSVPDPNLWGAFESFPDEAFCGEQLINLSKLPGHFGAVVGAGCLMVRKRVFEKTPMPWFSIPWKPVENGGALCQGEDVFFSNLVQEYGFDIYLDTRIKSPHYVGKKCYPPEWDLNG